MFKDLFESLRKNLSKFFDNRFLVISVMLSILALILVVRLFNLQIIQENTYYEDYVNTTKKEVSIPAMRGNIYDRNGKLLAGNRVVYNVTLSDENYYTKSDGAFNEMLIRLIHLLKEYDVKVTSTIPVVISSRKNYVFQGSTSKVKRFIRDVYGEEKIKEFKEKGQDVYAFSAETVMTYLMKHLYNFSDSWENAEKVSKEDALDICNIRYALAATTFTRYISTIIAGDVDMNVQAAVLENQSDIQGVNIEETYERDYKDSECFSSILGYVGSITGEEIEDLNAQGGDYMAGDVIGKEGIESTYENYLQGIKGKKTIYVNSTGMILKEEIIEEPKQGNDIYLSVDADTTVATYNVIKQQLAGIIVNHLYEGTDYDPEVAYEKSEYLIPIRDVYFQMINNKVLSMEHMANSEASAVEKSMHEKMVGRKEEVVSWISNLLNTEQDRPLSDMDEYEKKYVKYLYSYLVSEGYLDTNSIQPEDKMYAAWKADEVSFSKVLIYALKNGWANLSKISDSERYNSVENCYRYIIEILLKEINVSFGDFDKLIYNELIHKDKITGNDVALCLFEQGVLEEDPVLKASLADQNNKTAFDFFEKKIISMEITPSMIALDPCSAGLVLTDPNTGELLSVVSYPGYDANRINDLEYYNSLLTDQSSPLYSRATQSRLAPGSTFKMVTATAALEGGYVTSKETIRCEGVYDKLDHPRCWIYRMKNGMHGDINIVTALGQSCNCYFYECGYRFSLNDAGAYSPSQGINVINNYATMYGFGELTGIECNENVSVLTNELPVTSAIGQGTNAFTTISLARYVTALASNGNIYECKLLDHIEDKKGKEIYSYKPQILRHLEFSDDTWDSIHKGMYTVVHEGGSREGDFDALRYQYAAKSGSAQENRLRAEHGLYVTYGPYDNISYAMAVQVPNGYSSGNAALIAKGVYEYLEGDITLDEILENSAARGNVNEVMD